MATAIVPSNGEKLSADSVTKSPTTLQRDANDLINGIDRRLAQLNSLLACSYGFGQDWLNEMGEKHRDNLMWLASDLGRDVERQFGDLKRNLAKTDGTFPFEGGQHV